MNKEYTMIRQFLFPALLFLSFLTVEAQDKEASDTTASAKEQSTEVAPAQSTDGAPQQQVEMADVMRSEGKIYVVVGIVLIVLSLMLIYLFTIDRNVKRLEKQLEEKGK
jgi:protein-disulfide isomerase